MDGFYHNNAPRFYGKIKKIEIQGGIALDERKEKDGALPEAEQTASESQALHDELEDLAKVFQEELDRAKAEAREVAENGVEEPEILIQGLEDLAERPAHRESVSKKRVGLSPHPFDWLNVLIALAAVCFVFFGGYVFATHTEGFVAVCKAEEYRRENQKYSALDAYAEALTVLENNKINAENVYKREILVASSLGIVSGIEEPARHIQAWEMSLPHFYKVKRALQSGAEFTETVTAAEEIIGPYKTAAPEKIPYDDLLSQLEALKTAAVPESTENTQSARKKGNQAERKIKFVRYFVLSVLSCAYEQP